MKKKLVLRVLSLCLLVLACVIACLGLFVSDDSNIRGYFSGYLVVRWAADMLYGRSTQELVSSESKGVT